MKKNQFKKIVFLIVFIFFFSGLKPKIAYLVDTAILRIAHNDGIQCYLNNREIINTLNQPQTHRYWNKEIDVKNYLLSGRNLLACRVSNGDGNPGTATGYFDLELVVDSQTIISKGSDNWKYFGQGGSTNPPYVDSNGRSWFHSDYNDNLWKIGSAPFDGTSGIILSKAPDDAWFRKSFYLSSSFYPPSNINCSDFTDEITCLNRGCFWLGSTCSNKPKENLNNFTLFGCFPPSFHRFGQYKNISLENTDEFLIDTYQPLITGLVKYGNEVEVYVNNQSIGKAIVKEGEDSGIANFYFKPKGSIVFSNDILKLHTLKVVAFNPLDQSTCSSKSINFRIKPYPAPVIHRLGEISFLMRANKLFIKTKNPVVAGTVKSNSIVEIFVDNQYIGRAKIQKGKNNRDNFYLKLPTLSLGKHTLYARARKLDNESIVSLPSQVFEFTIVE